MRAFGARVLVRSAAATLLFLTVLSANGLAQGIRALDNAGFTEGPSALVRRAGLVWDRLGAPPRTFVADEEQPGILRVAGFISACTSPDDRLFVLGEHPELYSLRIADSPVAMRGCSRIITAVTPMRR